MAGRVVRFPPLWVVSALLAVAWNPYGFVAAHTFTEQVEKAGGRLGGAAFAFGIAPPVLLFVALALLPLARRPGRPRAVRWAARGPTWLLVVALYVVGTAASQPFRQLERQVEPSLASPDGRHVLTVIEVREAALMDADRSHRVVLRTRGAFGVQRDVLTLCVRHDAPDGPVSLRWLTEGEAEIVEADRGGEHRVFRLVLDGPRTRTEPSGYFCPGMYASSPGS